MGINPTKNAIIRLLKSNPLSNCEISSSWSSTGWLADQLIIYPMRTKNSFNESYNPTSISKFQAQKHKSKEPFKQEQLINLPATTLADLSMGNVSGLTEKSKKVLENMNGYRKNNNMDVYEESDKEDQVVQKRDIKLNLRNIKKILKATFASNEGGSGVRINDIDEIISATGKDKSLKFDIKRIKADHMFVLNEISKPLSITEDEIKGDYARIYRNFPVNYIPHVDGAKVIDQVHNFQRFEKPSNVGATESMKMGARDGGIGLDPNFDESAQSKPITETAGFSQLKQARYGALSSANVAGNKDLLLKLHNLESK